MINLTLPLRRRLAWVTAGAILGAAITLRLQAAPAPEAPTTPTAPLGKKAEVVDYDAGHARWLNEPKTVELSEQVTFNQDDAFLKTEAAVVQLDDQRRALNAQSLGPVHLYDTQDDLTGRQGYIDFTRHIATLKDNIVLLVKPGSQEQSAPKGSLRSRFTDAATLTCDLMSYDYRHKIGHVPGSLTVHQKDRVLTADAGEYNARTQIVTLTGHVHGHDGQNDVTAPKLVLNITEGHETMEIPAPVHGQFLVKDEEDDPDEQKSGSNAAPVKVPEPKTGSPADGSPAKPAPAGGAPPPAAGAAVQNPAGTDTPPGATVSPTGEH